ncbi:Integrator complex subunit 2 [Dissophora ornata]|nr:Integrator complex subunit 2 [Dissophora ornata]
MGAVDSDAVNEEDVDVEDYALCLPLLLSRYSLDSVPFLARYPQRQVKEELQLEKQSLTTTTIASRTRAFESGTTEERARIVLVELAVLLQSHGIRHSERKQQDQDLSVLSNPLYRQEVSIILATSILLCKRPLLNIQAIIQSLRSVRNPASLITFLVANHPTEFTPTIEALLETDDPYRNSKTILLRLCKLGDHKIWGVRQRLIDQMVYPNLAIELTIEHCHDEICFMNRILRGQPEWLTNGTDPVTKTSLTSIMEFVFSSLNDELTSERPDHVTVNRLLRILSGMVGLMNLSLSAEQLEISLGVLEMKPLEPSTIDVKICLILMSATQLLKYSQHRVDRVLHRLMSCQESTQVLYLVVWFQLQQLLMIDDFASRSLSMNIVIPRTGLMELSTLFSTLFSSEELASCALRIGRPSRTSSWTADSPGISTITASLQPSRPGSSQDASELRSTANFLVGYLLQQDVFQKSATDVRSWVMEQIQASTVPLDANMIHLLRAYTSAIARSKHITRIPEQEIRAFFSDPCEDPTPSKVLLVLYMLMSNDVSISNLGNSNRKQNPEYDATLFEYLQIRKVFLFVQNFQGGLAFQAVQPMFLKLVNAQFPELFDVTTLLLEEGLVTSPGTAGVSESSSKDLGAAATSTNAQHYLKAEEAKISMEPHIEAIMNHIYNPDAAVKGYHTFQRLTQSDRQNMARIIVQASLPSLLDPRSNPAVMEAFKNTWDGLNSVMPHDLWAMTINVLLSQESSYTPQATNTPIASQQTLRQALQQPPPLPQQQQQLGFYTFEWLVQDPLLLFKVDFRVFRSPIIFRLFVQILGAVMAGSRHWFRKHFHASQATLQAQQNRNPAQAQRRQFKEANLSAMLYIQDSALIQLMLEVCQARPDDKREPFPKYAVAGKGIVGGSEQKHIGTHRRSGKDSKNAKAVVATAIEATKDTTATAEHIEEVSDVLKEIRIVTFNFLHQLFIDHKIFPKLVHFQGYALDLVPTTVAGIDSIHVCLDFLQEILFASPPISSSANITTTGDGLVGPAQDVVSPQVFALRLAAQLCERFPLKNTMQMAIDFILPRLQALLISTGFAKEVLDSAVVLAKAFPSLGGDIMSIVRDTSGPHDKMALNRTVDAIHQILSDPAECDKSLL